MENQRVRLTKRLLKEALVRLLKKKKIEKITVYELCGEAEINRTTFYKYYGSQHDLLNEMQEDFLNELEFNLHENPCPASLLNILTYIDTNRELCRTLLDSASDGGFLERIFSLSTVTKQLNEQIAPQYSANSREYVKEFLIYGSYSVIRKWLMSDQPEPPEEITELITRLITHD